jgi:protein-tyrosine phosphatase
MKILMVCLGNIYRSPLAEGILAHKTKHLNIKVDSAETAGYHIGNLPDERSIEIAEKYNIDLTKQRARQFSRADFDDFDIIYAMDTNNYTHLISLDNNETERNRVCLILNEVNPEKFESVPDPYHGGDDGFQKIYIMLNDACNKIISQID